MVEEGEKPVSGKKTAERRRRTTPKGAAGKGSPWTFPKNTLEEAILIPKAIEEKNAGNPMPAQDLAVAVGFRQAQDWRFLDLLRSANQYGLVTGTGKSASIHLAKLGQDVVAPSSPGERAEALLSAFRNVKDFEAVEKFYSGKRIPEDEFFLNTLTREFNIPRDRVEVFAKVFLENLKYLRAFSRAFTAGPSSSELSGASGEVPAAATPPEKVPSPVVSKDRESASS
jgi:hypothetical protein